VVSLPPVPGASAFARTAENIAMLRPDLDGVLVAERRTMAR